MNQTHRMMVIAAAVVGGIGFTPEVAEDSTLGVSTLGTSVKPILRISKLRDEIRLQGHTISLAHERDLVALATDAFPDYTITTAFEPLGLVPQQWEDTSAKALQTLAAAESGTAELDASNVLFNVVAIDTDAWSSGQQSLGSSLAPGVSIQDNSIPAPESNFGVLCRDAAADFSLGAINFTEATDQFRSSAYPRLEQLAALADACRDSVVRITGHSDSTGEEEWNRTLSLLRARAVAGYLQSKGIAEERLEAAGVGSAEPIASNENRYGRGLNRRIEVEFVSD